jgi:plasmid stabilization system protein ParE
MARLIWSPRSLQDLIDICDFVARDSRQRAAELADLFIELVERLPEQPHAGSIVPEYDRSDLRERFLFKYRVLYLIRDTDVEVVRILHGARNLPDAMIE